MLIIFFIVPCQKAANASKAVCKHYLFYAVRFALQQAMQQHGGFANLLFFYRKKL
jgi:hypothetical protein